MARPLWNTTFERDLRFAVRLAAEIVFEKPTVSENRCPPSPLPMCTT